MGRLVKRQPHLSPPAPRRGHQTPAEIRPLFRAAIEAAGLKDKAMLVQNCGLPGEKICKRLDEASDDISYFTTIIVKE